MEMKGFVNSFSYFSVSSSSDGGSTSGSLNGEPFYLHKEGVYTRVNELFKTQKEEKQSLSGLKGKLI